MLKYMLVFVPITAALAFFVHPADWIIFTCAALSIIPIAAMMGEATENLAVKTGPTIGGLLNATFGNATELIIAFFALRAGKIDVVKASITGSMISNMLLVLGLALFLGGLKHKKQIFNKDVAGALSSLLIIVMIAFLVPAIFDFTERGEGIAPVQVMISDEKFSLAASVVLIGLYICNLIFSLVHRPLELMGLFGATVITASVARDGETNWLEGAMLLGVYLLLALAFFFLPVGV